MNKIKVIWTLSIIMLISLLASIAAYGGAGTCVQRLLKYGDCAILSFSCTAGSSDHLYPATVTSTAYTPQIQGYYVTQVDTLPGSPAPTNAYDIVINDVGNKDIMGGTLADRSNTAGQTALPIVSSGLYYQPTVKGTLNIAISNNLVNSANVSVDVYMWRN